MAIGWNSTAQVSSFHSRAAAWQGRLLLETNEIHFTIAKDSGLLPFLVQPSAAPWVCGVTGSFICVRGFALDRGQLANPLDSAHIFNHQNWFQRTLVKRLFSVTQHLRELIFYFSPGRMKQWKFLLEKFTTLQPDRMLISRQARRWNSRLLSFSIFTFSYRWDLCFNDLFCASSLQLSGTDSFINLH